MSALEVWGGVECTVNRVRDCYYDQLDRSGHVHRLADLDRLARPGIKALAFPAPWERLAPDSVSHIDWTWTDAALERIRSLGLRPIVGLVHHGSGPSYTNLTDPLFPEKLAAFARRFAERYPWIDAYTPINEPLTTARFSGLYGLWYPHARDDYAFVRAFVNECTAIRASMEAVRRVNPAARLIQTEDLGRVYSTPSIRYQADFENHRRWLTFD